MNCLPPVIVDAINNSVKTFANVSKVTIGRNQNSSIDIPDPNISRNQCVIALTDNNKWTIKDLSSHRTTFLNNRRLLDHIPVLENGDKITFPCPGVELFFYYSIDDVPTIFKKRKPEECEKESLLSTPSKRICKGPKKDDDLTEEIGVINVVEKKDMPLLGFKGQSKEEQLKILSDELEKYKQLYLNTFDELTGVKNEKALTGDKLNSATKELENLKSEMNGQISIIEKEKEILKHKLKKEEEANEKMVLEIQELNERLKESEQEQIRLAKESDQSDNGAEKDEVATKSEEKEKEDDYFSALALQKIVDLVEVKYHEVELDQLKAELKKKDDKITDLTLETEKRKQEVMDIIDRELLCSICSEVLCNAITLNCKHTFCQACVVEWKNKKRECPVCRARIKFEVHPLLIDSFLDRLFDVIGGELKTRRDEVKAERSNSAMNAPSTSKGNGNNSRRGSQQHRNPRRGRGNFNSLASMNLLQPQLVIDLRDIGQELLSGNVIDLTTSSPQSRRGRSRSINYYNL